MPRARKRLLHETQAAQVGNLMKSRVNAVAQGTSVPYLPPAVDKRRVRMACPFTLLPLTSQCSACTACRKGPF